MEAAVARFRSRMAASNRDYLAARIAEQRDQPLSEASKVYTMSRIWFRWGESHNAWQRTPPGPWSYPPEQYRLESSVKTLEDIAALPHLHMDGTVPPLNEAVRRRFMTALSAVVNDYADVNLLGSEDTIYIPDELEQFLALTNGVYDADFRHSGICDFSPAHGFSDASKETGYGTYGMADPDDWAAMGVHFLQDELDVAAGVLVDQAGQWPELWPEQSDDMWFSMYALCRTAGAEDEPWGWRVVFYHKMGVAEYRMWSFTSIVDFLDWYSSWDSRLQENDSVYDVTRELPDGQKIAIYGPGAGTVILQ